MNIFVHFVAVPLTLEKTILPNATKHIGMVSSAVPSKSKITNLIIDSVNSTNYSSRIACYYSI